MSVEQVVKFLWKTIINWAVQPRLNTLPTLLAGPARSPARPSNTGASNRNLRQQHGACCPPSTHVLGLCVQRSNRTKCRDLLHNTLLDQKAHTTQHTHHTHIWTAVIHTLHIHTLQWSHSTPAMDRLMHSYLFLGRTPHRKNSDKMTRQQELLRTHAASQTGASPPHTIHTTRKYEWPTTTCSLLDKAGVLRRYLGQQFSAHLCSCDGAGAVVL